MLSAVPTTGANTHLREHDVKRIAIALAFVTTTAPGGSTEMLKIERFDNVGQYWDILIRDLPATQEILVKCAISDSAGRYIATKETYVTGPVDTATVRAPTENENVTKAECWVIN
jgi:hypothetical protein